MKNLTNLSVLKNLQAKYGHAPLVSQMSVFNVREDQIAAIEGLYMQLKETPDDEETRTKLDTAMKAEKEFWTPYTRGEKEITAELKRDWDVYVQVVGGMDHALVDDDPTDFEINDDSAEDLQHRKPK